MGAGQFAMSFTLPLDQWFAAAFGTGAIATLGYASRIIWLGMSLGGAVIARATLPIFAGAVHGGEAERVRRHALWWGGLMLLVGAAFAVVVWALATPIVRLLFERGAFAGHDTAAVAEALRWGILQVPPYLASLVFLSEVTARGRYDLIAIITFANLVCKAIGNWVFGDMFGLNGVLLASAAMYLFSMLMFFLAVSWPRRPEPVQAI
jgi:peptidoglycan biosynthesis protein MviN/MurJ (putative lipid II flippase)